MGGEWGGRRISAPPGRATRPTTDRVREAWMSAIAPDLPGARVLDLYAGSGALGLEALSRGADRATFVENDPRVLEVLRRNLATLAVPSERARVVRADALRYARRLGTHEFDIALADPPYASGHAAQLAELHGRTPFARLLCIEHARNESLEVDSVEREGLYGDTKLTFLRADDE